MTTTSTALPTTALEAIKAISAATFRDLTRHERYAYADAPADAQIWDDETLTILIGGDRVEFYHIDDQGEMTDACMEWHNAN